MSDFSDTGSGSETDPDYTGFPSYDETVGREENLERLRKFLKENNPSLYESLQERGDIVDVERVFEEYRTK